MEINGVAHIQLTVGDFGAAVAFYEKLLPLLGLVPVIRNDSYFYCVGGRTGSPSLRPTRSTGAGGSSRGASDCTMSVFGRVSAPTWTRCTPSSWRSAPGLCTRRRTRRGLPGTTRCCSRIRMGSDSR